MQIKHPLWAGSMLKLQSGFLSEERMLEETRAYIRSKRRCDDLTTSELTFIDELEKWINQKVY